MGGVIITALKQRVLVFFIMIAVFAGGVLAFTKLNIEAYPDPVPPLVDIIVQSPGQSAEEMERYMTIPVEIQMAGIPNVNAIRTISLFGLSDIKVQFTYDFTYQEAEQWVINRLSQLPPLPNGATPQISPESPIGEIMRYRVAGPPGYSVMDLKTIEDWMLERRFKAVPGVVDVNGWGGKTKIYEVTVNQDALVHYGLTIPQVIAALNNSNVNVGGQTVNFGAQAAVIRGLGLIDSMHDIGDTMLTQNNGSPVLIRDVAAVQVGSEPRLGIAGQDSDNDIVQGIVLMRRGAESLPTIKRVEALIAKINTSNILPPGVHIEKTCAPRSSPPRPSPSRWPSRSGCCCCWASQPICCPSAPSILGWWSMQPSSWWRTSSADCRSRRRCASSDPPLCTGCAPPPNCTADSRSSPTPRPR
jgi:cobalt-zinc-cadmium resistance protein CzcA